MAFTTIPAPRPCSRGDGAADRQPGAHSVYRTLGLLLCPALSLNSIALCPAGPPAQEMSDPEQASAGACYSCWASASATPAKNTQPPGGASGEVLRFLPATAGF